MIIIIIIKVIWAQDQWGSVYFKRAVCPLLLCSVWARVTCLSDWPWHWGSGQARPGWHWHQAGLTAWQPHLHLTSPVLPAAPFYPLQSQPGQTERGRERSTVVSTKGGKLHFPTTNIIGEEDEQDQKNIITAFKEFNVSRELIKVLYLM